MSVQLLKQIEQAGLTDNVLAALDAAAAKDPSQIAQLSHLLDARLPEVNQQLDAFISRHGKRLYDIFASEDQSDDEQMREARAMIAGSNAPFALQTTFEEHALAIKQLKEQLETAKMKQSQLELQQRIDARFQLTVEESTEGRLCSALAMLNDLRNDLEGEEAARLEADQMSDISSNVARQYGSVESEARAVWHRKVQLSETRLEVTGDAALEDAAKALSLLGQLNSQAKLLSGKLEAIFLLPVLRQSKCRNEGNVIVLGDTGDSGLAAAETLLDYLAKCLPAEVLSSIKRHLIPPMIDELQQTFLPAQLPVEVQSTERIQKLMESVRAFESKLAELGLLVDTNLTEWVDAIARHWYTRKRDSVLEDARAMVLSWDGSTEQVEMRQDVTGQDLAESATLTASDTQVSKAVQQDEEDDTEDAWGSSEWEVEDAKPDEPDAKDDEVDAWGLDEDLSLPVTPGPSKQAFAALSEADPTRTVTLSERYAVSSLPKGLLGLINAIRDDTKTLQASSSPIQAAHKDLPQTLPLIMLLWRSLVPHLCKMGFPRMLLYNDLTYLATRLVEQDSEMKSTSESLKKLGDSFYKLEIEEKQQQIHTIFDSTSGFVACTTPAQTAACTAAVQDCLDLFARLQERWESTLSHTTLLTALGNLVETAVARFTYEIMSMTDIAEQESTELARLGDLLATVEGKLFWNAQQEQALAAPYVPSWFKFRYCLEILEANLVYILDLYRDGALEDFDKRELVDMIQALFADSDKRRMAISEIQGGKRWQ